jgi:hypothetical protein
MGFAKAQILSGTVIGAEPENEDAEKSEEEKDDSNPPPKEKFHRTYRRGPIKPELPKTIGQKLTLKGIARALAHFWSRLPLKVWVFFVNALYIPAYRWEWRKYRRWSYEINGKGKPRDLERLETIAKERRRLSMHYSNAERHKGCRRFTFNVSGTRFQTQLRTLERYPHTLLGK